MKKIVASAVVTVLLSSFCFGVARTLQSKPDISLDLLWKKVEREKNDDLPRSAIETLKVIENSARASGDNDALLKALSERIEQEQRIYTGDFYSQAPEFERKASQAENPVEQTFIYDKAADFYLTYYLRNSWRIDKRPEMTGTVSDSLDSWSRRRFIDTIVAVSERSFNLPQLKTESTKKYPELLKSASYTAAQAPSLYDLFVKQAVSRFESVAFLRYYAAPDTVMSARIVALYDDLIFYNRQKEEEAAVIYNELEKLAYLQKTSKITGDEYIGSIEKLEREFKNSRYITAVLLAEMNHYLMSGEEKDIEKAYQIGKEALTAYAGYPEIDKIEASVRSITQPFVNGNVEKAYPGEEIRFSTSYRNIDSVTVAFYRISESPLRFFDDMYPSADSLLPSARLIKESVFRIKENKPYRTDTDTLRLPSLPLGLYQYKVAAYSSDTVVFRYTVLPITEFAGLLSRVENGNFNCWVVTSKEGKPVEGAEVVLYGVTKKGDRLIEKKRMKTDKLGMLTDISKSGNGQEYYRVCLKGDTASLPQRLPGYWGGTGRRGMDDRAYLYTRLYLYTDRGIYRPGETVWFKGILIEKTEGKDRALAAKKQTVLLRDRNGKIISQTELKTNDYGSIEGSFRLPDDENSGYYSISSDNGSADFLVEYYKRPNFEVSLTENDRGYLAGGEVELNGMAKTYSGISLQNATFHYTVTGRSNPFPMHTRVYPPIYRSEEFITSGEGALDEKGAFTIRFRSLPSIDTGVYGINRQYKVSGYITDSRGETQPFEEMVTVGEKRFFLNTEVPGLVEKESGLALVLKGTNVNGKEIKAEGNLELLQVKAKDTVSVWKSAFTAGEDVRTGEAGKFSSGRYLLRATAVSVFGDTARWEKGIVFYSPKDKAPPVDTTLWVIRADTELAPGKEAVIVVGTSKKRLYVLYELYGKEGVIERKLLNLSNRNEEILIPYSAAIEKGGTVLLNSLYDGDLLTEKIALTRASSSVKPVISWETWRSRLYPGNSDTVTLRVTAQGKGLAAEVLAAMYDASLDAIVPHAWMLNEPLEFQAFPATGFYLNRFYSSFYIPFNLYPYGYEDISAFSLGREKALVGKSAGVVLYDNAAPMEASVAAQAITETRGSGPSDSDNTVRKDFTPTAFFYPVLRSDADGKVSFTFKIPHSLTRWNLKVLASTKEGAMAQSSQTVVTQKELMVTPLLPGFIREGDSLHIRASVNSLLEKEQNVEISCEFYNPYTGKRLLSQNGSAVLPPMGEYIFEAPLNLSGYTGSLGCRFKAAGLHHADVVEMEIPVLPSYITIKEGESIELKAGGRQSFATASSKGSPKQVDVEVCSNLTAYVVKAIPELAVPRSDDAVSWMTAYYTASVATHLLSVYPDLAAAVKDRTFSEPNRMEYLKNRSLEQLQKLQNDNGGWSWFSGMPSSVTVTLRVLKDLAQLDEMDVVSYSDSEMLMQSEALDYLDRWIARLYKEIKNRDKYILTGTQLEYLYLRSLYGKIPVKDETQEAVRFFTGLARSQWPGKPAGTKIMTALLMQSPEDRPTYKKIFGSVGEYPLPENISEAVLLLRFYGALGEEAPRTEELIRFILKNKKSNVWRSDTETMDALFALFKYNPDKTGRSGVLTIEKEGQPLLNRHVVRPMVVDTFSFSGTQLGGEKGSMEFVNLSEATLWVGAVRRFDEQLADTRPYANGISVERQYYRTAQGEKGEILTPIDEKDVVSVGDKIVVRLKVSSPEERSYMRLRDYFPANLEAGNVLSGSRFYEGSWVYETQNDQYKSFYVEQLKKGTTMFEYTLFAAVEGNCRGGYAEVESSFAEEFGGHTGSTRVTMK